MLLHVRAGAFARAVELSEAAAQAGAVDAAVLGLRGHALTYLGRTPEADRAYADALALAPEDPYLRHLVASAGHAPPPERAAPDYVRAVFDDYARHFDQHLIDLGYRVPGLMRAALLRRLAGDDGALGPMWRGLPWLDLGCGTGLCAVVLSDLPLGPATGVDLSPNMLAEARAKGLYAHLIEADLLDALDADDNPPWKLIVSGDTFCYFGDLSKLFDRIAIRLAVGGIFIFSVELLDDDEQDQAGWRLGARARYSHRPSFVAERIAAAGLVIRAMDEVAIRTDACVPVPGLLIVAERLA
jgi:predicted TPR repeat methyltransferase